MSQVPAATRTLQVLRFLGAQPEPVPAERIAGALGLPRSSTYHLLACLVDEGFAIRSDDRRGFGLGPAAYEVGTGYARQAPLQRIARLRLAALVDEVGESAHLATLHGREVLYVLEERAPGRPSLVTDVGVRLPATLTASGRAILAALPAAQVRALFDERDTFVLRGGRGPASLSALRALLTDTRSRGYAVEAGDVTPGLASVAVAVHDHTGHPVAGLAVTYPEEGGAGPERVARAVERVAEDITARLGG